MRACIKSGNLLDRRRPTNVAMQSRTAVYTLSSLLSLWLVILAFGLMASSSALGQVQTPDANQAPTAARFTDWRYLRDPGGRLSLATVQSLAPDRFQVVSFGLLSAGYTRDVFWFRFNVLSPSSSWYLDILPPYLDDLRIYRIDDRNDSAPVELRGGDHMPYSQRAVAYRGFAYRMEPTGDTPQTFLLRVQTTSAYHLVARVWADSEFAAQAGLEAALGFAALAILLTFLVLNLNHLVWAKDALQAWLCAYLASLLWVYTAVLGFSAQFVIPNHPEWNGLWMGLGNMVMMTTSSGFLRHLLGRRGYWFYLIGGWLPALGVIGVILGYYPEIMPVFFAFYLMLTIVGMGLSVGLLRRAETGALLTFFAIFSGLVGVLIMILNLEGLLLGGLTLLYSMMGCTILQVGLLHLAVGSKYQKLNVERIQAAHKVLLAEEEACREREARVEQSELFAMISHEIKTPLTMINGAIQSLEALVLGSPDIDRRHERIRRAVWRIDSLVQKALEYDLSESQMSSAGADVSFDISQTLDRVLRQYDLPEGRIRLRMGYRPCRVRGQSRLIEILLGNLIENAIKYGAEAPIEIIVAPEGHDARIDIKDWGPGIAPELIPHLFERYRRGSDHGNITGAGLGLYLVARIAQWHGGDVRYVAPEEGGACFLVRLPLASPEQETLAEDKVGA